MQPTTSRATMVILPFAHTRTAYVADGFGLKNALREMEGKQEY